MSIWSKVWYACVVAAMVACPANASLKTLTIEDRIGAYSFRLHLFDPSWGTVLKVEGEASYGQEYSAYNPYQGGVVDLCGRIDVDVGDFLRFNNRPFDSCEATYETDRPRNWFQDRYSLALDPAEVVGSGFRDYTVTSMDPALFLYLNQNEIVPLRPSDVERISSGGLLSLTYTYAPAPEPSTWIFLTAGFALAGAALRRRKRTAAHQRKALHNLEWPDCFV